MRPAGGAGPAIRRPGWRRRILRRCGHDRRKPDGRLTRARYRKCLSLLLDCRMTEKSPRKGTPRPHLRGLTKHTRPASGTPAGGAGIGGPANGAGRPPGIGPTSAETLAGRARNALIADRAFERVDQAFAMIDLVLANDAHPQAFAAAKYILDRVAGTPGASVTVAEESPSTVYFRWASEEEPTRA